MKFGIDGNAFKEALERVSGIIMKGDENSPIPSCGVIKLSADGSRVTVSSDGASYFCDVAIPANVVQNGSCQLDKKDLKKLYAVTGEVTVSANGNRLTINNGKKKSELVTPNFDPLFINGNRNGDFVRTMEADCGKLIRVLERCYLCVSANDVRELLMGFCFDCTNGNVVALDGYRMNVADMVVHGITVAKEADFVVPGKRLMEAVKKLVRKCDRDCRMVISVSDECALFGYESKDCTVRYGVNLIHGSYPDYLRIIPKSFRHEFFAKPMEIESVMKEYIGYKESNLVYFTHDGNALHSCMYSDGFKTCNKIESFKSETHETEVDTIALNAVYVRDGMEVVTEDEVLFQWNDTVKPMMVTEPGFTEIILPIRGVENFPSVEDFVLNGK